jgi:hypothetical protein
MRARTLVRFDRRFEESPIRGYVLSVGPQLFLLSLVSDRIWFDGFEAFRISDVRHLRPDPHAAFAEAALKRRRQRLPSRPKVSLATTGALLRSAGKQFPLVALHRETVTPDVCHIGRPVRVYGGRVSLLEIDPDAAWDREPTEYNLAQVTRVGFGADYEDALHIVGGEPRTG